MRWLPFGVALLVLLGTPGGAVQPETEPSQPVEGGSTEPQQDALVVPSRLASEVAQQLTRLRKRDEELDVRERSVEELEAQARRMLEEVESVRSAVESRIAEWTENTGDRVVRLAKVYAAMPPGRAAPLLEALDLDLTTEIVTKMKYKQSAQVLALMSKETALRLSRNAARPLALDGSNTATSVGGTQ